MNYKEKIDYSSLSCYLDCPRQFMFKYMMFLQNKNKSIDLVFGSAYHYGLEKAYELLKENNKVSVSDLAKASCDGFNLYWSVEGAPYFPDPDIIFPKSPGHAANMYKKYWDTYHEEDREDTIIGIEIPFRLKFHDDLPFYIGRIDLATQRDESIKIIDHKTASMINKITSIGFNSSMQSDGYITVGKIYYDKLPTMVYSVSVCQKSKIYFERMSVYKNDQSTERFIKEFQMFVKQIHADIDIFEMEKEQHLKNRDYIPISFSRSPGYSCTKYFRPCPYMDLCMYRNNPMEFGLEAPNGFEIKEWDPDSHEAEVSKLLKEAS